MIQANDAFDCPIYTTEPQLTRALAAEFRQHPRVTTHYVSRCTGKQLSRLETVSCEKDARLDIILTFTDNDGLRQQVGIEAKVNHSLTRSQLEKENAAVDALIVLVLDADDAVSFQDMVDAVVTWSDLLGQFDRPRITLSDLESLPAQKVHVERMLRKLCNDLRLPEGWTAWVERGGSAMPGITFVSPATTNGSNLCGQIQVTGRCMPAQLTDVKLEFYVGTQVVDNDECYPALDSSEPPTWVRNARILYCDVLHGDPRSYALKTRAPGTSKRSRGQRRKDLTNLYLRDAPWLAQGYIDWCAGVRCHPRPIDQAAELATDAVKLATEWWNALSDRQLPANDAPPTSHSSSTEATEPAVG